MEKLHTLGKLPGNKGSKSSSNSGNYSYDRPNVYFSEGKVTGITKDSNGIFQINNQNMGSYTRLTIKRSPKNRNDISIYNGNKLVASYNASSNNKSDGIKYYDPSSHKYVARHGGAELSGVLEGLTATDIRNFARFVADNPGSENQYTYGVSEGKLFSIQNSAQRVTKDLNASADAMQALWDELFAPNLNYGGYGQDSDLNPW